MSKRACGEQRVVDNDVDTRPTLDGAAAFVDIQIPARGGRVEAVWRVGKGEASKCCDAHSLMRAQLARHAPITSA